MSTKEKTMQLPVRLTSHETEMMGVELASKLSEIDVVDLELASAKALAKAKKEPINERLNHLRGCLNSGHESRPVTCIEEINDVSMSVITTRLDTGEVVHERPMTVEERQRPIKFEGREVAQ